MTAPTDDDRLALGAWTAPPPPPGLADHVLATVHGRAVLPSPPPPRASWKRRALIAGAVVAAAGVTFALWPPAARDRGGQLTATAPSLVALDGDVEAMVEAGAHLSWKPTDRGLAVHHDAGTITFRHRGDRRLEVVTPSGTLLSERASFRVEVPMKRIAAAGGAVAVAAVVVAVYQGRVLAEEPGREPVAIEAGGQHTLGAPPPRPIAVAAATLDRTRRIALARAIAEARQAPRPGGGAAPAAPADPTGYGVIGAAPPADTTPGELTRDEIRTGVKEIVPLLTECFELQLEANPQLGRSTVHTKLVIDSEATLGTVVSVNGLDVEGSLAGNADFGDCLTATFEAMVLPPIADGGHLEIDYPFQFHRNDSPGTDEDAGATPAPTPMTPKKPPPARPATPPPPAGATPASLVEDASIAAMQAQWARSLMLAEQALAFQPPPTDSKLTSKAHIIAGLAACNLRDAAKARRHYGKVPSSARDMLRQRCLAAGRFDPASP